MAAGISLKHQISTKKHIIYDSVPSSSTNNTITFILRFDSIELEVDEL